MNKIIKENAVLIIGISLPILLAVFFMLTTTLPKLWVAPPKYDFLYVTYKYNTLQRSDWAVYVDVSNGKLKVWQQKLNQSDSRSPATPRLFIFEAKNQASREISIPIPENNSTASADNIPIIIPEFQNANIDSSAQSPDGYTVSSQQPYDSGMDSLFFSSYDYRNNAMMLKKDGNIIRVTLPEPYSVNTKFLGWILSK